MFFSFPHLEFLSLDWVHRNRYLSNIVRTFSTFPQAIALRDLFLQGTRPFNVRNPLHQFLCFAQDKGSPHLVPVSQE